MEKSEKKELIIYGKRPVYEALRSDYPVNKIFIAREIDKKDLQKISGLADKKSIQIIYEKKANLQKICGPVLHQGFVAILNEFRYLNESQVFDRINSSEDPLVLILDQIQDPHNLGAIIRTAEIAGVSIIVLPEKGSASINATVAKTSAGAVFHCPIHRTTDLPALIEKFRQENLKIIATVPNKKETIYDSDLNGPLVIVVGSEGKGVRKNIHQLCDYSVSIPGWGKVESLNASVSTAIILFEAVRQRKYRS